MLPDVDLALHLCRNQRANSSDQGARADQSAVVRHFGNTGQARRIDTLGLAHCCLTVFDTIQ